MTAEMTAEMTGSGLAISHFPELFMLSITIQKFPLIPFDLMTGFDRDLLSAAAELKLTFTRQDGID
ncbi:MAG: hypothetical protein PHE96_09515 [Methylococcales bacterium]|nr:hypothetical protein [Methylococcales bacterium]